MWIEIRNSLIRIHTDCLNAMMNLPKQLDAADPDAQTDSADDVLRCIIFVADEGLNTLHEALSYSFRIAYLLAIIWQQDYS